MNAKEGFVENEQAGGITALKEEVAKWYAERFGSFFSRATNQGLGSFVLLALFLTTSLVAGRIAVFTYISDQRFLANLMQTEMEPMTEITRGGVLTVVLFALQDQQLSSGLYCGGRQIGD